MQNVIIKGNETLTDDHYENLTINGYTETEKNLTIENLTVNGFFKCTGNFSCREFVCKGTTRLTGDVSIDNLTCKGALLSSGEKAIKANRIVCSGAVKISSDIQADMFDVKGSFTIKNDGCIKARSINAEGSVAINNTIDAETINSFGFIYAETIIAKSIYIRSKKTPVSKALKQEGVDTTLPLIIGDEVELVNVKAEEVKGKYVKIGANCRIDRVEYSKNIEIDESAKVGETVRI